MEIPRPLPPVEKLKQDPLYREVLPENPWLVDRLEDLYQFDRATFEHSDEVARIYSALRLDKKNSRKLNDAIIMAGLAHDLGKMKVDRRIVQKSGPLTPEEAEEMARHVDESSLMISPHNLLIDAIVQPHHSFQRNPYPRIIVVSPLIPREFPQDFALCDSVHGMRSDNRPYRTSPLGEDEVISKLSEYHDEGRIRYVLDIFDEVKGTKNLETPAPALI